MKSCRVLFLSLLLTIAILLVVGCTGTTPPDVPDTEPAVQNTVLNIVEGQASSYSIIISERASETVNTMAMDLRKTVEQLTGVKLGLSDDYVERGTTPAATEILIGHTAREESRRLLEDTPYGEYSIRAVGDRIVVAGWDENALQIACTKLIGYMEEHAAAGQLSVPGDYALSGRTFAGLDCLPHYGDSDTAVQFINIADNSRMLYVKKTNADEFHAYVAKLADAGFTEFATRQMGDNLYAIYKNDKKILHASYHAANKEARITVDDAYDMTLFAEQEYEKVCEPAVHLLGLEFNSPSNPDEYVQNALGIIFRLEDGRFVIVDGNYFGDRQAKELYDALCKLAVDENDITVAAWIFTHAHNDHVGAFCTLADSQWKDKIKIENFLYHFTTTEQYKNAGGSGALGDVRSAMRKYPDANHIKVHTGQVLKVGGAEIEILFTFADSEPTVLTNFNATSVVLRFITQGNTVLVPGDATDGDCNYLARKYGDYLKSDIVQITHHGYNGTSSFYRAVDADVILWAGGARQFYGEGDLYRIKDWEHNKVALSLAEECYIAGETGHTLILPYTPKDNKTVKIYDGK
jgi:hypothetical protein